MKYSLLTLNKLNLNLKIRSACLLIKIPCLYIVYIYTKKLVSKRYYPTRIKKSNFQQSKQRKIKFLFHENF